MPADRLIDAAEVAKILGVGVRTIRRYDADTSPARSFPKPVRLPSPGGKRPLVRWRETEILAFGRLA